MNVGAAARVFDEAQSRDLIMLALDQIVTFVVSWVRALVGTLALCHTLENSFVVPGGP